MKRHYWQYLIDSAGNAVPGARIHLFLATTNTYAWIQQTEIAVAYTTTELTEILTDEDGFFHFWLSDDNENPTYGYPITQKFRIEFYKAGLASGEIDDVQIIWGGSDGKVKINAEDTSIDYLQNKLLEGNNIAISPSGEQLVIAFEGIADTYKVKIDENDTPDYLENKVVAGSNITVSSSGGQLIITGDEVEPGSSELTFTGDSLTVAASATGTFTLSNFLNRGLCHYLKVEDIGIGVYYDVYLCKDSSFGSDFDEINYFARSINSVELFEDYEPFWIKDSENSSQLYLKIINKDSYTGNFSITLICEKFA